MFARNDSLCKAATAALSAGDSGRKKSKSYRVAAQRERNCSFGTMQLCIFSAACGSVLRSVRLKSVGGQKQSGSVSISRWSSSYLLSVFTFASTRTGWMDGCYSPPAASAFHQLFTPLSPIPPPFYLVYLFLFQF